MSSNNFTNWRKTLEYMFPNEQMPIQLGSWILDKQSNWLNYWDWFVATDRQFPYFRHGLSLWHHFLRCPNLHHSYFGEFLVEDSPLVPLLCATVEGDVETIYLLNSSAQQSRSSRYSSRLDTTQRPSNYSPHYHLGNRTPPYFSVYTTSDQ